MRKSVRITIEIILGACILFAVAFGILVGVALGETKNIEITDRIGEQQLALPSGPGKSRRT